jgi:chitin disaccharide deacetylase
MNAMNPLNPRQTNRLLGYPAEARLLILNADDLGMCHAVNEAIVRTLKAGVVRSTTLMVPCPWALHARRFLAEHPEIPFGVHLTVTCDADDYRWGPVAGRDKVPSLVDETGYFYTWPRIPEFLAQVRLDQLEAEFRAQIETVLAAGLRPDHLDWHALRLGGRVDISDLMFSLAKEYGLALRVIGRAAIEKVRGQGLPVIDFDFLDSYGLDPASKPARYAQLLHDLPAGLSEWAIHPALDTPEMLAVEPTEKHERQADFEFWTSERAKEVVKEEGIILVDYRAVQAVWKGK